MLLCGFIKSDLLTGETAGRIRRTIEMTQVVQIFEEEKKQALARAIQTFEEEKEQAMLQVEQEFEEKHRQIIQDIVTKMIEKGYTTEEIVSLVPGYSQDDVEMLRKRL